MGLDPERFWAITPRLMTVEMRGAAERVRRERANVWYTAMLPHLKKPPSLADFVGAPPGSDRAETVRRWVDAWDKIDRALSRGTG